MYQSDEIKIPNINQNEQILRKQQELILETYRIIDRIPEKNLIAEEPLTAIAFLTLCYNNFQTSSELILQLLDILGIDLEIFQKSIIRILNYHKEKIPENILNSINIIHKIFRDKYKIF